MTAQRPGGLEPGRVLFLPESGPFLLPDWAGGVGWSWEEGEIFGQRESFVPAPLAASNNPR